MVAINPGDFEKTGFYCEVNVVQNQVEFLSF